MTICNRRACDKSRFVAGTISEDRITLDRITVPTNHPMHASHLRNIPIPPTTPLPTMPSLPALTIYTFGLTALLAGFYSVFGPETPTCVPESQVRPPLELPTSSRKSP